MNGVRRLACRNLAPYLSFADLTVSVHPKVLVLLAVAMPGLSAMGQFLSNKATLSLDTS